MNRDFVLYNFRIELVQELLREGYEVAIALPYGPKVDDLIQLGCAFYPVSIDKRGKNIVKDIRLIKQYIKLFKSIQPDVILTYTTKVNIYAGILAGKMHIPYIMNISGLGTAVENKGVLQKFMIGLYKQAAKKARCLFFQNQENLDFFLQKNMYQGAYHLIPGSGVNLDRWLYMEYPSSESNIEFLFIARVIKEKGIEEYLHVAKKIKQEYDNIIFRVLGPCDGNYQELLQEYEENGWIKYHGMVSDTRPFLKKAHCTIHPSYYPEGISNVLLESAACGRPAITTTRSGCKETVEDEVSGFLFEPQNEQQLYVCVKKFINLSNQEKKKMGILAREKMVKEFNRDIVTQAYMKEIVHVQK